MFVPAQTPRAIVGRLHVETMKALQVPSVRDKLAGFDVVPMPLKPAEFDAYIRDDIIAQGALAKAAGLKPN